MKRFRSPSKWTALERHSYWTDKSGGPDACWPWTGSLSQIGYGRFGLNRSNVLAHRFAWEAVNGPIPHGLKACHRCDNRKCQNPSHLFVATQADNVADMYAKGRARNLSGPMNGNAKLTLEQVAEILASPLSQSQLGAKYGVHQAQISRIKRGTAWAAQRGIELEGK